MKKLEVTYSRRSRTKYGGFTCVWLTETFRVFQKNHFSQWVLLNSFGLKYKAGDVFEDESFLPFRVGTHVVANGCITYTAKEIK